jgi:hypothetical protein
MDLNDVICEWMCLVHDIIETSEGSICYRSEIYDYAKRSWKHSALIPYVSFGEGGGERGTKEGQILDKEKLIVLMPGIVSFIFCYISF